MVKAAAGLLTAVLAGLAVVPPALVEQLPYRCLSLLVWHRACYGCGMTRALSRLLHGDWTGAAALHSHSGLWLAGLVAGNGILWWLALRKSDSISA
jgi:hypothetical protein